MAAEQAVALFHEFRGSRDRENELNLSVVGH
jgi:hypothetical protein